MKKTIDELLHAADAAEKRAKELRAKARKETQAQEAKTNAEIIKALKVWLCSFPEDKRMLWSEIPQYFLNRADSISQKFAGNEKPPSLNKRFGG